MSAPAVIFYILSVFILVSGLLAVSTRKIFRSAIWLLFSLTGIAGLYFWLQMEFIAAVQIVVYVGGIVVLIIFSIFLTQKSGKELPAPIRSRILFSALSVCAGFGLTFTLIRQYTFTPSLRPATEAGVGNIGMQLLSTSEHGYILPFEVVSLLLLAAMIGCIVIAMKSKPGDQ
jgi:NADH-quinone oxidoreductase subunit J